MGHLTIGSGNPPRVQPDRVRYIKLGKSGQYEGACLRDGVNRVGFYTVKPEVFRLCQLGNWDALAKWFVDNGRGKGTATLFTNEIKAFFEDDGSILWITFIDECLYWGLASAIEPQPSADFVGVVRPIQGGWRNANVKGKALTKDGLSGALTKLTMYRGTSCEVRGAVKDYVVRRINGQEPLAVKRAIKAREEMEASALDLMRSLEWRDFEILVDLVFSTSGWRRLGSVGGPEKTRDIDLYLPSTEERAFVQVKSRTTLPELKRYIARIDPLYDKMFFVYHSGDIGFDEYLDDPRVKVIGPGKLAKMIIDAGLIGWLIQKTS